MNDSEVRRPYVSFVVAARNDNYGGNFLQRIQLFVNSLLTQCLEFRLDAELIIVEWNPPTENPRLMEALTWPQGLKPGMVRIVDVPAEYHRCLPNADLIPMFEYRAKNVGIRRARGEFVLVTNPDIVYSRKLIRFIGTRNLAESCFYRSDRYDVPPVSGDDLTDPEARCMANVLKVNTLGGSFDFTGPITGWGWWRLMYRLCKHRLWNWRQRHIRVESLLHTNASGDFFLMAASHWRRLRGFPENSAVTHLDGYLCVMAAAGGVKQVLLPGAMRLFHHQHARLVDTTTPHEAGRLKIYEEWVRDGRDMLSSHRPSIHNDEQWGAADYELREEVNS